MNVTRCDGGRMIMDIHDIPEHILLKSVLDAVSDGVTVIDRDFNVVFQNESLHQKFGTITGRLCYEAYRGRVEPCNAFRA